MKFGLIYEHQLPKPWAEGDEARRIHESLQQIVLADQVGFDSAWLTEHHFLEEVSHSSAPEVFLGAAAALTTNIRLAHGVCLSPPAYNHPARVAERLATLDILSNGRVEWGTGESSTLMELEGFGIDPAHKTAMWREGVGEAADMMAMTPYPGFQGAHFAMPARNVVPKPLQTPHPPLWMACSRRESILRAARNGCGALVFGFVEPAQAKAWRDEYYRVIASDDCVPVGRSVTPNFAIVNGMMLHPDYDEARRRSADGLKFFGYGIAHYAMYGEHVPGETNIWERYQEVRDRMGEGAGAGCIGSPETVRAHLRAYEEAGVDQMLFLQQGGQILHEHIMESIALFAAEVMPEFAARSPEIERRKAEHLAPHIAAALARKPPRSAIPIAPVAAAGLAAERRGTTPTDHATNPGSYIADPTRGGAIPVATRDLYKN